MVTETPARAGAWRRWRHTLDLVAEHHPWLLVAMTFALFATKTLFNAPFWLMALLGAVHMLRSPRSLFTDPVLRLLAGLFLCIWVPLVASLPDAVNPARALQTTLPYFHFLLAAVFMAISLRRPRQFQRLTLALFVIISIWCLDALVQIASGRDLFGYPYTPGQLSGMFYPKLRLGHMLAICLPVYLEVIRRRGHDWSWIGALVVVAVLLLSGKRVAWMAGILTTVCYGFYWYGVSRPIRVGRLVTAVTATVVILVVLIGLHKPLQQRIVATLGLFSGQTQILDRATAHRLPIWRTALTVARSHWINGVGPRGFRDVYAQAAEPDNFYLRQGRNGQTHPHLALLEIAAETGAIGLFGCLLFWWLLIRRAWGELRRFHPATPWLITVLAAWLPFNAHLAFYGSYWSSVSWLVLSLAVTSLYDRGAAMKS